MTHPALAKPVGTRTEEECWEIAQDNKGLLLKNLKKFAAKAGTSSTLDFDDLFQEGMLLLYAAARRYDPSRGFKFSTYAMFWLGKFRTVGANDRKPKGLSRKKGAGEHNNYIAYVNSLENMADRIGEDGATEDYIPGAGSVLEDGREWVDHERLSAAISRILTEISEEDGKLVRAAMAEEPMKPVGVQLGKSRGWADYRWRKILKPQLSKRLQEEMGYDLAEY